MLSSVTSRNITVLSLNRCLVGFISYRPVTVLLIQGAAVSTGGCTREAWQKGLRARVKAGVVGRNPRAGG